MTEKGKMKEAQFHAVVCMILTNMKLMGGRLKANHRRSHSV